MHTRQFHKIRDVFASGCLRDHAGTGVATVMLQNLHSIILQRFLHLKRTSRCCQSCLNKMRDNAAKQP